MDALKDPPNTLGKPLLTLDKEATVMCTPCNHKYHEECLMAWMKAKLECPSCRQSIPPLDNSDT